MRAVNILTPSCTNLPALHVARRTGRLGCLPSEFLLVRTPGCGDELFT